MLVCVKNNIQPDHHSHANRLRTVSWGVTVLAGALKAFNRCGNPEGSRVMVAKLRDIGKADDEQKGWQVVDAPCSLSLPGKEDYNGQQARIQAQIWVEAPHFDLSVVCTCLYLGYEDESLLPESLVVKQLCDDDHDESH